MIRSPRAPAGTKKEDGGPPFLHLDEKARSRQLVLTFWLQRGACERAGLVLREEPPPPQTGPTGENHQVGNNDSALFSRFLPLPPG